MYWFATIPGIKYHPSLTCWCIHFFLPADHSVLVGGSHISSHQSHFAQFVEGWAEPVWLQGTDTSTSSWMVWHQSRSLWQPRCSARAPSRSRTMEGQVSEPVPSPWLPGLDQEQAPGWPSITPAGCWPWQGWDAHSLLCHLHGLIPPERFQQIFQRLGEILSEQRNKAGHHSASLATCLYSFPFPLERNSPAQGSCACPGCLDRSHNSPPPHSEQPAALWQCRLLFVLCLALLTFSGS